MAGPDSEGLITDEMRATIGKESSPWASEIDKTWIRMFARSVGHTDPVYFDEAAAKAAGYRSLPCPPGYLGTPVFNPTTPARGGQAQPEPRKPMNRRLNGGTELEYFDDICAGDVLNVSSHIESIEETLGSLGPMLVTRTQTVYKRDGKTVAIATGTGLRY